MEKIDCKEGWRKVDRHLAIPISDDVMNASINELISRMDGSDVDDYKLNHLRWETLENLCCETILQYGNTLKKYDFSGPYIVNDLSIETMNPAERTEYINLNLTVKDDVCIWCRDAKYRGRTVKTLIRWHLRTNLLTSVSVIGESELFDSRVQSFENNQYLHIEDALADLIVDVFKVLRLPGYIEDREILKCVWGNVQG